jgi:hypothetical protein
MPEYDTATIVIRPAYPDDADAIARLAALDSAPLPRGLLLVAESDGELRAALSPVNGTVIADPFVRTVELVALLQLRARGRAVRILGARRPTRGARLRWLLRTA